MKTLSDELLNKYIDGELEAGELGEVKEQLKSSEEDRRRLTALRAVHSELKKIEEYRVPDNFTSALMMKIGKTFKVSRKDRYFIFSISSIFMICAVGILGYLIFAIGSSVGQSAAEQSFQNYISLLLNKLGVIANIFTAKNISIIGSIFSLALLISGYFFYENLRQSRRHLTKMR